MYLIRCFFLFAVILALAPPTLSAASIKPDELTRGSVFSITFDEPVVKQEQLAKVAEGFLEVSPALDFEASWLTPNRLLVRINGDVPYQSVYTWKVARRMKFLSGKSIPRDVGKTYGPRELNLRFQNGERGYGGITTVSPYYVFDANGMDIPPSLFKDCMYIDGRNKLNSRKAKIGNTTINALEKVDGYMIKDLVRRLKKTTPREKWDEKTQKVLIIEPVKSLVPDITYELVLTEKNKTIYKQRLPEVLKFYPQLRYDPSSQPNIKIRTMTLFFPVALKVPDLEVFFRENISIRADDVFLKNAERGAVKELEGLKIEVDPDSLKKASQDKSIKYVTLLIHSDDVFECVLNVHRAESVDGQQFDNDEGLVAEIQLPTPSLYLDTLNNGMLNMGHRQIGFTMRNLQDLQFSTKKIDPQFVFTASNAYETYYQKNRNGRISTNRVNDMKFVPLELIDPMSAIVEKNMPAQGKGRMMIPFEKIYGDNPAPGMYLMEVRGTFPEAVLKGYERFGYTDNHGEHHDFNKDGAGIVAQALIQLTNLGMLWKVTGNDVFVYGYALDTGSPLADGYVEFADKAGKVLKRQQLANGVAITDAPNDTSFIRIGSGDDSLIVRTGGESSKVDLWDFDIKRRRGFHPMLDKLDITATDYESLKVFTFTDRSIYKPGEEFHFKAIARILKNNDIKGLRDKKAKLVLKNPRGNEIMTRDIVFSDYDTYDFSYSLPEEEVGTYTVELEMTPLKTNTDADGDNQWYIDRFWTSRFRHSIPVQVFKRNAFEVTSTLGETEPGTTSVTITNEAVNYTGVPVSKGRVNIVLTSRNTNFYPKLYRDYYFGDHAGRDPEYWQTYYGYRRGMRPSGSTTVKSDGMLDENGELVSIIDLPEQKEPRSRMIDIASMITDSNEQTIGAACSRTIHPASVYVGIKTDSYVRRAGRELPVSLIAVDLDGNPCKDDVNVEVTAKYRKFTSHRYVSEDRTTVKNDEYEENAFSTFATITAGDSQDSAKGGKVLGIPVDKAGIYDITVSGKDDADLAFMSRVRVWVYGDGSSPWEYRDGMKIDVIPDKPLYKPGDTAKILLQTPIEGDIVVTLEREKVLRSYQRKIDLKNNVIEIPIEDGDAPNVYASVFLVKGAKENERELKDPQLKLGYCTLHVQPARKVLNIELKVPDESVLPGSETTISGVVKGYDDKPAASSEVTLYVEDEGTLDVIGYKTPQPVSFFYDTRYLDVETFTMLGYLLSEDMASRYQWGNKGVFIGDKGYDAFAVSRASADGGHTGGPFGEALYRMLRKNFNPCAFWIGNAQTDAQGGFTVKYKNPDTLTRYRVIAVAADKGDRFGSADATYVVNKPVMLEPAPPFFASQGDELVIPVTVSKTVERSGPWKITLKGNNTTSIPESERIVTIPDKGGITEPFLVKFVDSGNATLTWSIVPVDERGNILKDGDHATMVDQVEKSFTVEFPAPLLNEIHHFTLKPGGAKASLRPLGLLSDELKGAKGSLDITMGTSPVLYMGDSMNFLLGYPYGCLEQKTSKIMPWLYADVLAEYLPSFPHFTEEKRKDVLSKGVVALLKHQQRNGALAYWDGSPGDGGNSEFAPYAALAILVCQERGIDVPDAALTKLWDNWRKASGQGGQEFSRYFAAWVMSRAGVLTEGELNKLLDDANANPTTRLDALYLALAVAESKRQDAGKLALGFVNRTNWRRNDSWRSSHEEALELILRTRVDRSAPETLACLNRIVSANAIYRHHYTWLSGWDTFAIGYYLSEGKKYADAATVAVKGRQPSILSLAADGKPVEIRLPLDDDSELSLESAGRDDTTVYGRLRASGKPSDLQFDAINNKGFVVSRGYSKKNAEGKWQSATEFHAGDIIKVEIWASNRSGRFDYAVIEDYLPSAFEPINPLLTSQSLDAKPQGYTWNGWVTHKKFLESKVRFFANTWRRGDEFYASYLVRVTKAGKVIAPPAKVELMYEPQFYGLSSNQVLIIKPREQDVPE